MKIQHIKAVEYSSHRTHEEMYSFKSWGSRWGVLHSSPRSIQNPPSPREPWVCQADLRDLKVCLEKDLVHVNQQLRLCQRRTVILFTP